MEVKANNSNTQDKKDLANNDIKDFWKFNFVNYSLFAIGLVFIFIGYILMYKGTVNSDQVIITSPRLLIIGYCIFIPLALIYEHNKAKDLFTRCKSFLNRGGSSTG